MNSRQLDYTIGSLPDHENFVLHIFVGNKALAEITKEPGCTLEIEIFPPYEGGSWKLEFDELKKIIDAGIKRFNQLNDKP